MEAQLYSMHKALGSVHNMRKGRGAEREGEARVGEKEERGGGVGEGEGRGAVRRRKSHCSNLLSKNYSVLSILRGQRRN